MVLALEIGSSGTVPRYVWQLTVHNFDLHIFEASVLDTDDLTWQNVWYSTFNSEFGSGRHENDASESIMLKGVSHEN